MGAFQRQYFEQRAKAGLTAPHPPFAGCTGKLPYDSFEKADIARKAVVRRNNADFRFGVLHAYRCHHCQKWHVGSHRP